MGLLDGILGGFGGAGQYGQYGQSHNPLHTTWESGGYGYSTGGRPAGSYGNGSYGYGGGYGSFPTVQGAGDFGKVINYLNVGRFGVQSVSGAVADVSQMVGVIKGAGHIVKGTDHQLGTYDYATGGQENEAKRYYQETSRGLESDNSQGSSQSVGQGEHLSRKEKRLLAREERLARKLNSGQLSESQEERLSHRLEKTDRKLHAAGYEGPTVLDQQNGTVGTAKDAVNYVRSVEAAMRANTPEDRRAALTAAKGYADKFVQADGQVHFPTNLRTSLTSPNGQQVPIEFTPQNSTYASSADAIKTFSNALVTMQNGIGGYKNQITDADLKPIDAALNSGQGAGNSTQLSNGNGTANAATGASASTYQPLDVPVAAGGTAKLYDHVNADIAKHISATQVEPLQELLVKAGFDLSTAHSADGLDGKLGKKTFAALNQATTNAGVKLADVKFDDANDPARKALIDSLNKRAAERVQANAPAPVAQAPSTGAAQTKTVENLTVTKTDMANAAVTEMARMEHVSVTSNNLMMMDAVEAKNADKPSVFTRDSQLDSKEVAYYAAKPGAHPAIDALVKEAGVAPGAAQPASTLPTAREIKISDARHNFLMSAASTLQFESGLSDQQIIKKIENEYADILVDKNKHSLIKVDGVLDARELAVLGDKAQAADKAKHDPFVWRIVKKDATMVDNVNKLEAIKPTLDALLAFEQIKPIKDVYTDTKPVDHDEKQPSAGGVKQAPAAKSL